MENFENSLFYKGCCTKQESRQSTTTYYMRCENGDGITEKRGVFPGVELLIHHYKAGSWPEPREYSPRLMELNFCVNGRFECVFPPKKVLVLASGDISVHSYEAFEDMVTVSSFPMGYYDGVAFLLDCEAATAWAAAHCGALAVDFWKIKETLLCASWYTVHPAGPRCEHVLRELYEQTPQAGQTYLRLKVLELFYLLGEYTPAQPQALYLPQSQLELIRHLRDHIVSDYTNYSTVAHLAAEHGVSVSWLQRMFRKIYGVPVHTYLRQYQLEKSALLLRTTNRPVTEIALESGFSSLGKFGESFKKYYQASPTQYRQSLAAAKPDTEMGQP
ncbi:MAG: AraC family transcriptional regulator [Gemmiger sp.]|nr:AraC family transcriptional regulator [Gemmiger sp.]